MFCLQAGCLGPEDIEAEPCPHAVAPGDVVFSEVFANPAGADPGHEWIEVYNPSATTIDLAGFELIAGRADGSGLKHLVISDLEIGPNDYAVLGNAADLGGLTPEFVDYAYGADLGPLRNTAGLLALRCGAVDLDRILYSDITEGRSRGFDGGQVPDEAGNDDLSAWCDATSEFGAGTGTPGNRNDLCVGPMGPTRCLENGRERPLRPPSPGDIRITEFLANPQATPDGEGEWFELFVATPIDLNGLVFTDTAIEGARESSIAQITCQPITPPYYAVFARTTDTGRNGGLPPVDGTFDFDLPNNDGTLVLRFGSTVLDRVEWSKTLAGVAMGFDLTATDELAPKAASRYCEATTPFGAGDLGTPGAQNRVACVTDVGPGECLDQGIARPVRAPRTGDLVISEFLADPRAVPDTHGEWFEVITTAEIDLNGLMFGRDLDQLRPLVAAGGECIVAEADQRLVFARSGDPTRNGGLPAIVATFSPGLANDTGALLLAVDGEILDRVTYGPTTPGVASSLDPRRTTPEANDDIQGFCPAMLLYGDGDLGTPGQGNPPCP